MTLNKQQAALCANNRTDFSGLSAVILNCTLKRPDTESHTGRLLSVPAEIMRRNGVSVEEVFGTQAALRRMTRQGHGRIVSVGSALGYRGIPLQAPYCAAKFAVRGFLDSLRSELIHDKSPVRLTEVHLPAVNTPQFDWARNKMPRRPQPVPPIYQPQAIARALYRAAHDAPREVWLGGSAVQVILGHAAAPGVLDRVLARKAYSGQQTHEPAEARLDNLFQPMDEARHYGANGRFDDRAAPEVAEYRPGRLRGGTVAVAGALVAGGLAVLLGASRGRRH